MAAITDKNRRIVKRLYYKDLYGARQIADKLGVSLDAVYYFMRRHKMKRRSFAEENKIRFDRKEPSFHIRKNLSPNEKQLKTIGTILYWGEGYKTEKSKGIDFTNSDPQMIDIFICFLRNICGVDESRLRVLLYCYSDQDPKRLIKFWSKLTGIQESQFSRPYIRSKNNNVTENKMKYGLIHIRYMDKKLLVAVKQWIENYKEQFCVGGRVAKYT